MVVATKLERGLVLFIDPGLRACGVALFAPYGRLLRAGLPRSLLQADTGIRGAEAWKAMSDAVLKWYLRPVEPGDSESICQPPTKIIVEEQRIDGRTRNPDDMLQVNGVAGSCTRLFPNAAVAGYWPEKWKSSLPKENMTERIRARLAESPDEAKRVERVTASLEHNTLDAIGIGLYHFGRLAARKVIAR